MESVSLPEPLSKLRAFARRTKPVERASPDICELCSQPLGAAHRHLLETAKRSIVCSCDPCALRFQAVVGGRYKLIPRDPRRLAGFTLSDARWEQLALPINLAFLVRTADGGVQALYPSPAGMTESLLPLDEWHALLQESNDLARLEPDVEALLVNRLGVESEYFVAPIDLCYELTGLIRKHWQGLSGGQEVREQMDAFFARLRARAR